jgi:hypothetical protein
MRVATRFDLNRVTSDLVPDARVALFHLAGGEEGLVAGNLGEIVGQHLLCDLGLLEAYNVGPDVLEEGAQSRWQLLHNRPQPIHIPRNDFHHEAPHKRVCPLKLFCPRCSGQSNSLISLLARSTDQGLGQDQNLEIQTKVWRQNIEKKIHFLFVERSNSPEARGKTDVRGKRDVLLRRKAGRKMRTGSLPPKSIQLARS